MSCEPVDLTCTPKRVKRKRKYQQVTEEETVEGDLLEHRRLMANCQERVRMQRINVALDVLKQTLPEEYHPCQRRMSKIRTLRCAMDYIRGLSQLLQDDNLRRQHIYGQAKQFVQGIYVSGDTSSDCMYSSHRTTNFQSVTPYTPLFPYLGPLCTSDASEYMFTPQQTPPVRHDAMIPRQLEFGAPRKQQHSTDDPTTTPQYLMAGSTEHSAHKSTPVTSRHTMYRCKRSQTFSTVPRQTHDIKPELDVAYMEPHSHDTLPVVNQDTAW
ncbi:OLIG2-like protein [Mya arenaria]|uniref:OLIG2-like protein n=1 Tax=Mya arenaria TaxID=6604 RepID=A0ABY7FT99_MYAAR|nr:oligodendrocyte transcription factor 3-like [Mya arenaria]WAR25445.1 OLIG2-like protein [Mya arenaria]